MEILVIGLESEFEELKAKFGEKNALIHADHHSALKTDIQFDCIFDFLVGESPDNFDFYNNLSDLDIFVNIPKISLQELLYFMEDRFENRVYGFNGLPTFINREILEVSILKEEDKLTLVEICQNLVVDGFSILATGGTTAALQAAGVPATRINKVMEGRPHAVNAMLSGDIQLVFNTAKGAGAIKDSFSLRQTALTNKVPYYTTVAGSRAAAEAIRALRAGQLGVRTLQDYLADISWQTLTSHLLIMPWL